MAKPKPVEKSKGAGTTKKLKCSCKSDFQDRTYGQGIRLHAATSGKNGVNWRCTVCGNEKM